MHNEFLTAVREAAHEVLIQAGQPFPPVDALAIAQSLAVDVALDRGQSHRGRIKRIAGRPALFLRPEERPERLQWAAAHELGESLAWKICHRLGLPGDELPPREREALANQFAQELLLPWDEFRRDVVAWNFELPRLKSRYRTASHGLIAGRWLDLDRPGIVTIFDHGALHRRRSNVPNSPPALTDLERQCWTRLRNVRRPQEFADARLTVHGWCIDSPGWQREILYATWEADE